MYNIILYFCELTEPLNVILLTFLSTFENSQFGKINTGTQRKIIFKQNIFNPLIFPFLILLFLDAVTFLFSLHTCIIFKIIYYDDLNSLSHTISCIYYYIVAWLFFSPKKMILRDLHIKSKWNVLEEGSGTGP